MLSSKLMDLAHKLVVGTLLHIWAILRIRLNYIHISLIVFQNEGLLGKWVWNSPPAIDGEFKQVRKLLFKNPILNSL